MVKNKYAQLFIRTVFLAIMVAGAVLSLGALTPKPNWYVYYTNLSNYLCLLIVFVEVIFTIAKFKRDEDTCEKDVHPALKFMALIAITVTFLVTNILLQNPLKVEYWSNAENVLMHMVNPLLFWIDWILFAKHQNTKWYYPLLEVIFPLIYVGYILIRGHFIAGTAPEWMTVYPYFFLDVDKLGYLGVTYWILALVGVFLVLGYLICFIDNIPNMARKHKEKKALKAHIKKLNEKNK